MQFGDLKSAKGLNSLNDYLTERSFIEGYTPSQADVSVFEALSGSPSSDYINALRWYNQINSYNSSERSSWPGEKKALGGAASAAKDDDDDSDDIFGDDSDDDDAEAEKIKQERLAAYAAKKANKTGPVAKSNIILDVKPWDDETDMQQMEKSVRSITCDGLVWGSSKLVPVGYGIKKLQISCVVEDEKVSTDFLEEQITAFEDIVQSMDIAAFNKI